MRLKLMLCAALVSMPLFAYADDIAVKKPASESSSEKPENQWCVVSGDVGFVTNYLYRGFTETFGGPTVQGEIVVSQKKEEGLFAGVWGSNVDNTTASNGSGLEALISGGYIYKAYEDLSLKLELRYTRYQGAFGSSPSTTDRKDSWDMFEIIPGFNY